MSRKINVAFAAAFALPILAGGMAAGLFSATPAAALPADPICVIITYFNDAHHDKQVGRRAACPGSPGQMTGQATAYFTVSHGGDATKVDVPSAGGSLPCEFLKDGCSEGLPVPHH
jgi:hypothetical protein